MTQPATAPSISVDDIERRTVVMRMGLYFMILTVAAGGALWFRNIISTLAFIAWIALEIPASWLVGTIAWYVIHMASSGFIHVLTSAGGTPPEYGFSEQQAMVMQGRIDDAIQSYRRYIDDHPGEIEGRIRLGLLLADGRRDEAGAEESLLEARILGPGPQQESIISNALIDLHTAAGRPEALRAELARFVQRYPGSTAAAHASERLRTLEPQAGAGQPQTE
ncbi:MAG TPA: hypothetical protein VGM77_10745 [Gemmatimonadales bacterium]|jgi:hypothetical protein